MSVFKHPTSTSDIKGILAEASLHAETLDGFDINGKLPNLYGGFQSRGSPPRRRHSLKATF